MNKQNCTAEQIKFANSVNVCEYALSNGYNLIKKGNDYTMKEHTSMVFRSNGKWYWNSRGVKGNTINFLMEYERISFVEAVLNINNVKESEKNNFPTICREVKNIFKAPQKIQNTSKIYNYLCDERCIDKNVIDELIKLNKIYLAKNDNICFIGTDFQEKPVSAYLRGTIKDSNFKQCVAGSNKKDYPSFLYGNITSDTLVICEATIDLLSLTTITKNAKVLYIAIGGLHQNCIDETISFSKNIKKIVVAVDNDNAGDEFYNQIFIKYKTVGFNIKRLTPFNKDFNEDLKTMKDNENVSYKYELKD